MTTAETAAAILVRFDNAWADLEKTVRELSERELTDVRDPAGWAVKDHLMHVAVWEQAFLAQVDGRPRHAGLGLDSSTEGSEDWDGLNAQIFARTRQRPLPEVLDALHGTHAATRARVVAVAAGRPTATSDKLLEDLPGYIDHYGQHHGWIRELVGRA